MNQTEPDEKTALAIVKAWQAARLALARCDDVCHRMPTNPLADTSKEQCEGLITRLECLAKQMNVRFE